MRKEDRQSDDDRDSSRGEDRPRSDVLGVSNVFVRFQRHRIREALYGCVQSLGQPDQRNCQDDPAPFIT
jgi:hypothetical protein